MNKYAVVMNLRNYYNTYFNEEYQKTYTPLYLYYLPPSLTKDKYYSELHDKKYYDGYGYNFYYNQNAYYEYSINPDYDEFHGSSSGIIFAVGLISIMLCIFGCNFCYVIAKKRKSNKKSKSNKDP